MDRDLILWASFILHLGKLLRKFQGSGTPVNDKTSSKETLQKFLNGTDPQQKWFPALFREDFQTLFLLSYYSQEGDTAEGKTSGQLDDSLLPYIHILARACQLSGLEPGKKEKEGKGLISIFSRVNREERKETEPYYLPLVPIDENESVFPNKETGEAPERLNAHLDAFLQELGRYMENKEKPDFDTFLYLAQKYLWCIPGPQAHTHPDVSLFEHLKTTAAIAAVLFDSGAVENFALVGFDISGIQEFIYTIASKGAAKSLKGRSFYLQLLETAVTKYILEELDLPLTNVVYCGGGKGFILAPAAKMTKLPALESQVQGFLFDHLGTTVYMGMAHENFAAAGFNAFNLILERLVRQLDKKKKQKFAGVLREKYFLLFEPPGSQPGPLESCSICGQEGKPARVEEEVRWCSQCNTFRELGTALRQAAALRENKQAGQSGRFSVGFRFGQKEYHYEFLTPGDLAEDSFPGSTLYFLNDTRLFGENLRSDCRTGFLFIAGNQVPLKENSPEVMDFDDLALCSTGAKKLGVIRGDVDNLGLIFSRGLGKTTSLGRISQLSFLLKHFFNSIANRVFKKENNEFIVYSGGDDFFVIGPWDRLIEDLVKFRESFARYTCFNPAFSFSASFSIFDGRYPAFKFAEVAGEQEKQAKDNKNASREKNSICFLDKVVFWDDFFHLKVLADELEDLLKRKIFNKSYIQLLQRIAQYNSLGRMKPRDQNELRQHARFHRWKWYYAWQAARLLERQKNKSQVKIPLEQMNDFLFASVYKGYRFINSESLYLIDIPARWAELKTRNP